MESCLARERVRTALRASHPRRRRTLGRADAPTEISHQTHATTNAPPPQRVVKLIAPDIPGNTGRIGRACRHAGRRRLHLVHPLGFSTDERSLRRAGLDYWPEIDRRGTLAVEHASWDRHFVGLRRIQAQQTQQQSAGSFGCTQHTPSGRIGTRLMLRATIYYLAARREAPLRRCTSMRRRWSRHAANGGGGAQHKPRSGRERGAVRGCEAMSVRRLGD